MELTSPDLREALAAAGQEHVLRHLDRLPGDARARLHGQLESLDLGRLTELRGLLAAPEAERPAPRLDPPELFPLQRGEAEERRAHEARERGAELLAHGKVGYVLVAGGQASRLGYDGPKGAFPAGPVSGMPLFELHARRLRAARERHGAPTPWYVMTSPANDAATRAFFDQHAFFGLPREDVFFFAQGMLPALDDEGRLLLAAKDSLFLAPDGHGGSLAGLRASGALANARSRGVERFSYFQVDNPLARPADPLFLGLHDLAGAGMSSKVVAKRHAAEKVGVLGRIDGSMGCIEYSDLPAELREARDDDGELRFRAGNIAVHVLDLAFVERITADGLDLPWHLARKAVRVVDEDGRPAERLATKFESFVFDALALSPASVTLEVERALEFSPIKNKAGEDSPATARADLCRLFSGWVAAAGRPRPAADTAVEVDPLVAESEQEFLAQDVPEPSIDERGHLYTLD